MTTYDTTARNVSTTLHVIRFWITLFITYMTCITTLMMFMRIVLGITPIVALSDLSVIFGMFGVLFYLYMFYQALAISIRRADLSSLFSDYLSYGILRGEYLLVFSIFTTIQLTLLKFFCNDSFSVMINFVLLALWMYTLCYGVYSFILSGKDNSLKHTLRALGFTPDLTVVLSSLVPPLFNVIKGAFGIQTFIIVLFGIFVQWVTTILLYDMMNFASYKMIVASLLIPLLFMTNLGTFYFLLRHFKKKNEYSTTTTRFKSVIRAITAVKLLLQIDSATTFATNMVSIYAQFDEEHAAVLDKIICKCFNTSSPYINIGMAQMMLTSESNDQPEVFDSIEEFFAKRKLFKKSVFYNQCVKAGRYFVFLGLTSAMGIQAHDKLFGPKAKKYIEKDICAKSIDDVLFDMAETAYFFTKTGYQYFVGHSLSEILRNADPIKNYIQEVEDAILALEKFETGKADLAKLSSIVRMLIMKGKSLEAGQLTPHVLSCVRKLEFQDKKLRVRIATGALDKKPFGLLLCGSSSIGKSYLTQLLFQGYFEYSQEIGENLDITWNPIYDMYTRNFVDKFWSMYNFQWAILFDDIAFENRKTLSSNPSNSVAELIGALNNVRYSTPQAEAADKGTKPLMARCVVATTNTKDLNARYVYAHPAAALRRLQYVITPKVKEEFLKPGSDVMLDDSKVRRDAWTFTVEEVVVTDKSYYYKTHLEDASLEQFQDWYRPAVQKHVLQQKAIVEATRKTIPKCPHGYFTEKCSKCIEEETAECYDQLDRFEDNGPQEEPSKIKMTMEEGGKSADETDYSTDVSTDGTLIQEGVFDDYGKCVTRRIRSHSNETSEFCAHTGLLRINCGCGSTFCTGTPPPKDHVESLKHILSDELAENLSRADQKYFYDTLRADQYFDDNGLYKATLYDHDDLPEKLCKLVGYSYYRSLARFAKWYGDTASTHYFDHKASLFILKRGVASATGAVVVKVAAALSVMLLASKIYTSIVKKKDKEEEEETIEQTGARDAWAKPVESHFAFMGASKSVRTNDLEKIVQRNTFYAKIIVGEKYSKVRCLGIAKKWFAIPAHAFLQNGDGPWELELFQGPQNQPLANYTKVIITKANLKFVPGKDICFMTHTSFQPVRDIRKFFLDEVPALAGKFLDRTGNWVDIIHHAKRPMKYVCAGRDFDFEYRLLVDTPHVEFGACGGAYLGVAPAGRIIVGFSVATFTPFTDSRIGAVGIQKKYFDFMEDDPTMSAGDFVHLTSGMRVREVHKKSLMRHESLEGRMIPLCSALDRKHPVSKTRDSKICEDVVRLWDKPKTHTVPKMKGELVDGKWMDPMLIGMKERSKTVESYDPDLYEECIKSFVKDIEAKIDNKALRPLTVTEAVNGIPGIRGLDAINRATSGGPKLPGPKKKYMFEVDGMWYPIPEVMETLQYFHSCYEKCEMANPLYDVVLKDEAVTLKKAAEYRTRTFTTCEFPFLILMKQMYATICASIFEVNVEIGVAAGMNCFSDWGKIYNYLNKFGTAETRNAGGDHPKFDLWMGAMRQGGGIEVLNRILLKNDSFKKYSHILHGIKADLQFPTLNFNGEIATAFGTQVSGHFLTLIGNSMTNLLDLRYCFAKSTGKHPSKFLDHIAAVVVGDDNDFTNDGTVDFGHLDVARELTEVGLGFSMPNKEDKPVNYFPLSTCEFLKRGFHSVDGNIVGPLNMDSLFKSLTTITESKVVCEDEQLGQIISNVNRELVLHGRETYFKYHAILEKILVLYPSIKPFVHHRFDQPYEQLLDWIMSGGFIDDIVIDEDVILTGHSSDGLNFFTNPLPSGLKRKANDLSFSTTSITNNYSENESSERYRTHLRTTKSKNPNFSEKIELTSEMGDITKMHNNDFQDHTEMLGNTTDPTFLQGNTSEADLKDFLERPVLIKSYEWIEGTNLLESFQPWELFLNNPALKNKLQNFSRLHGNLMLQFNITGNQQMQGLAMASYAYLDRTIEDLSVGTLTTRSQRRKLFLNPTTRSGGCLCLPFLWSENFIDLTKTIPKLGRIDLDSFDPLESQSNLASQSVTITVLAWMDKPVLTGPTSIALTSEQGFVLTAEDEISGDGPVSSIAAAAADMAGKLEDIPVIGRFAKATKIGANAAGAIASLFGFSKPATVDDVKFMRNMPLQGLANADGNDTSQKLTLTKRQEICVDSNTAGDPIKEDQLAIMHIAKIESYFGQINWEYSDAVDDWLGSIPVTPCVYHANLTRRIPTAIGMVSYPFEAWSGSLKYRFIIPSSKFTQGKLAIVYDPVSLSGVTTDTYNTNYTQIIDLSETRDFEITVPWQQTEPYKSTDFATTDSIIYSGNSALRIQVNGYIGIRVLNTLIQPDGETPVKILCFVSAGDDFEVANPAMDMARTLFIPPIAEESRIALTSEQNVDGFPLDEETPEFEGKTMPLGTGPSVRDMKSTVFYGERVGSLRQLTKRFVPTRVFRVQDDAYTSTDYGVLNQVEWPQFPPWRQVGGTAVDIDGTYTPTTAVHYCAASFVGWRGSMRYKLLGTEGVDTMFVERWLGHSLLNIGIQVQTAINASNYYRLWEWMRMAYTGSGGTSSNMRVLEWEVPYAERFRFSQTLRTWFNDVSDWYPYGCTQRISLYSSGNPGVATLLTAAGDDFQVFGWLGAAPFTIYSYA